MNEHLGEFFGFYWTWLLCWPVIGLVEDEDVFPVMASSSRVKKYALTPRQYYGFHTLHMSSSPPEQNTPRIICPES
jgi:hypothetical protein